MSGSRERGRMMGVSLLREDGKEGEGRTNPPSDEANSTILLEEDYSFELFRIRMPFYYEKRAFHPKQ